jgi:hypothetical protein
MSLYPAEVFEYELSGKIEVKNGIIKVVWYKNKKKSFSI